MWAPHILGGALVELSWQGGRLVGKENDIKQQLQFLVKRRKSHFGGILLKEAKLAPNSNSNWELQRGQNWT